MGSLATLKSRLRVEEVIAQTVTLKPTSTWFIGRCPWHDDRGRPNLVVFPTTQTWMCFACNARGDVVDWIQRQTGRSVTDILRDAGPNLPGTLPPVLRPPRPRLASAEQRDRVYHLWTDHLTLSRTHAHHLAARGLTSDTIERAGLKTHHAGPVPAGLHPVNVPGFHHLPSEDWVALGPDGLWIPVRDLEGRIVGAQIRTPSAANKYRWFSSSAKGGPSPGAPCHYVPGLGGTLWITEGPLKAIVTHHFLHAPVLGIPGVSVWSHAVPLIESLAPRALVIAFDQDSNPEAAQHVQEASLSLAQALHRVEGPIWQAIWLGAKGIDDVLAQRLPWKLVPVRG